MSVTEISVKRPAAIIMFVVLMIGLGVIGYMRMGADLMPSVNVPVITISTTYAGASAEEIKKDIVKPIEDSIAGIRGIDTIQSTANESVGQTIIQFTMETDMNSAFMDVQKAVDASSGKLPSDASKPVINKIDMGQMGVLTLSVSGSAPYDELYHQADKIKQSIEKISGVGNVTLQGAQDKELSIKVDKTALEYYNIDLNTIVNQLKSNNVNMPGGQIKQDKSTQSLKVIGEFKDVQEIRNLLIPISGGGSIRLAELADVQLQYPEQTQLIRLSGQNTIGISVQKQSDANVVKAVDNVKKELAKITKSLPQGVNVTIATDSTTAIHAYLSDMQRSLVEGIITTTIVLLIFLKSWRSSLVVLVAIPTSLIATFFAMYMSKFTLNMMSLMGLALCIGVLVDDSIVILENIQKHLAMGKSPIQAALDGRKEIGMAAVAITLCDVVVYVPVAFTSGMVGQFLREFGLTVAFASLFSLVISFTLTPMMASRILKRKEKESQQQLLQEPGAKKNRFLSGFADIFTKVTGIYKKFLIWTLDHRWRIVAVILLGVVGSFALIPAGLIKFEFMPQSDQGAFVIDMKLSSGSTLQQTDEKVKQVEEYLHNIKEVEDFYTTVGASSGYGANNDTASASINVNLIDKAKRHRSQNQIATEVRKWGKTIPGIDFIVSESEMGSGSSNPIALNIKGDDSDTLKEVANKVEELVKSVPGIIDVKNSAKTSQSELRVNIDRLAATMYGVSPASIGTVIRTGVQGSDAGVYRQNGDEYDIVVKFLDNQVKTPNDLGSIKVANSKGQLISIDQVASVEKADSPQSISRLDRQDVVKITANIQGKTLGEVNTEIQKELKTISLPSGYSIDFGGSQQDMNDTFSSLGMALLASIVLVYMILVVLYESFLTPAIRMLSLPCAIIGALGILALTGQSLNMTSMIGLIMLDGLASKNGTLLIDYTNTLMGKGKSLRDALIEAGVTRLRPIIMTSLTMIVGMLPAAFALGEGSEMKKGMALVVIGGMVSSTVLSPILLPVVYTLMDDIKHFFRRNKREEKVTHVVEG